MQANWTVKFYSIAKTQSPTPCALLELGLVGWWPNWTLDLFGIGIGSRGTGLGTRD